MQKQKNSKYTKKIIAKRAIALTLIAVMGAGAGQRAIASTISNAQNKINEANQQLNQANDKISDIEGQQSALQTQIDATDAELVALLLDIEVLEGEIDQKKKDIAKSEKDLKEAQDNADRQYDSMKKRIRFMYERGDNSMIEALLGATSMADFLNRVEYFTQIYDYDRNQLDVYKETVQQVADNKAILEQEQEEMEQLLENQEQQSQALQAKLDTMKSTMDDYDTKLAEAQRLADAYKKTIDEQNAIIAAEQERIRQEEIRRQQEEQRRREEEAARQQQQQQQQQQQSGDTQVAEEQPSSDSGKNPAYSTNISGQDVVNYASQFIGNPYVWGGTSLTNGADCSGFTMKVFEHFGISLPHSSLLQRSCGKEVSYANAQPGDLICYSGHVAIYAGGGRIVGAQSSRSGITTANATYRTILSVRRVL